MRMSDMVEIDNKNACSYANEQKSGDLGKLVDTAAQILVNSGPMCCHRDPRMEDLAEDTLLWQELLADAAELSDRYHDVLRGIRTKGTVLKQNSKGAFIIRPVIDPSGRRGWKSENEYKEWRDRWVKKYIPNILEALDRLSKSLLSRQGLNT